MDWKLKFLCLCLVSGVCCAQKCTQIFDHQNVSQHIRCENVVSMNDIADEIRSDWVSVKIVNKATHAHFSNVAVNVPYLNHIQSLDLSRVGVLNFTDPGFISYDALRFLDLSNTGLKDLKPSWFSRKTIETLDLSRNQLTELKRVDMNFFPKMRVFNASNNNLKSVEANTFIDLKKVEAIVLSNNHIPHVHFESVKNLRYLNLRSNKIPSIWATLTKMPKLEVLIVSENSINAINDRAFESLESLRHLNLSNNNIPHVHPNTYAGAIKTKLAEFDLSYNSIATVFHAGLHELPLLTFLDLSNNKITEIYDKNFIKQTLLQSLYLNDNRISKIGPKAFEFCLQLRLLDLSNNKLTSFTSALFGPKFAGNRLRKLYLNNNDIKTLDETLFAMLRNLVSLNLSANKITNISATVFKNNVNLVEFFFDDNDVEFISENVFKPLVNLEEISLQSNRITFIPDTAHLKKLQKVSITNNPFQCACLHEFIIWARTNKVKVVNAKANIKNPDCVVIESSAACAKEEQAVLSFDAYNRFLDGMPFEENERVNFEF